MGGHRATHQRDSSRSQSLAPGCWLEYDGPVACPAYHSFIPCSGHYPEGKWFETGTPNQLVKVLACHGVIFGSLEGEEASESDLGAFDIDRTSDQSLLFQSGFLALIGSKQRQGKILHRLVHPNRGARQCF